MSAPMTNRGSLEAESEMLPQDPPPWIVRSSSRLLIAMFLVALIASFVVHLPETADCPFVLVPKNGADPIQSPRVATVSKVCVREGQTIKAGADLFVLRSDEIRGMDTQSLTLAADLAAHEESLKKSDAANASELEIKLVEIAQTDSELKFREKHTASSRDLLDRMEKLAANGGISQVELIKLRLELAESEKDESVTMRTLQQVNIQRQQMETEYSRKRGEEVAEIAKLKVRLAALKGDLENSQASLLSVRAPYDAVVISVSQRNAGNVVQSGQELCQLSRADAQPLARLSLNEAALAKLAPGQRVRFFFDAFPYQRYGAVNAKLDWISPSVVTSAEGPRFIALASFDETEPSAHRPQLPLKVGMKGEARIQVGRRSPIEYAFEPIRQLRENVHN
jgi:multidrug resistance efflux pump